MSDLKHFRFWCYKVLPLVYDDSLSYYEVLCKVVKYINDLIDSDKEIIEDVEALKEDLKTVQTWINNFDTSYAESIIKEALAKMIYVDISDDGYIVYHIPDEWSEVDFKTTGLDIDLPYQSEYGHLVLRLWDETQGSEEEN